MALLIKEKPLYKGEAYHPLSEDVVIDEIDT
jgi:hypothetical protein